MGSRRGVKRRVVVRVVLTFFPTQMLAVVMLVMASPLLPLMFATLVLAMFECSTIVFARLTGMLVFTMFAYFVMAEVFVVIVRCRARRQPQNPERYQCATQRSPVHDASALFRGT